MIGLLLDLSVRRRWLVLLLCTLAALLGGVAATRLPIDAVPDITNNQVQVNAVVPSLSPFDVEKQV
ncbi:MAG: efflux RND transporter permease subunit, partial [Actinomycetospora chiangmaiensis]|nr:efflux RND transporter permease subunit [Actinomycetospora chiangmaiensis]